MLGACFRLRNSAFRRLPNPTTDRWAENISPLDLMKLFRYEMEEHCAPVEEGGEPELEQLEHVKDMTLMLSDALANTNIERLGIGHREMIHDVLEDCTRHIQTFPEDIIKEIISAHLQKVMGALDDPGNPLGYNRHDSSKDMKQHWVKFYFGIIRRAVISKTTKKKEWNRLWVTLMLRMLCWFILHDFDPRDVKIVPSNLRGSRIPVYIG
jgi:hypothetical protein